MDTIKTKIPYTKPSITDLEIKYASDAARHGWGEDCYTYIETFEREFAAYLGVKCAIATSSCTGALHMGLSALGIGPGDEVILADTNWIATAAPIVHLGATPVFVDILPGSWCIDPMKAQDAITPRTKAIIATHLYGNLCDMFELKEICYKHGIPLIEDAAEAIGSTYRGHKAGSIGFFGTFSFHGSKTITTGEGGMLVTDDEELYRRVLRLNNHGRAPGSKIQFWPEVIGFKYRMSNIQAALGCAQLQRVEELVQRKREIMHRYRDVFSPYPGIYMNPPAVEETRSGYWMPTLVFDRDLWITREALLEAFERENIDARVFFYPLSSLPMFTGEGRNYFSWDIPRRAINLPSYHDITVEEQNRVIEVILGLMEGRE